MEQARADLMRAGEAARAAGDGALELEVRLTLARCLLGLADYERAVTTADAVDARARATGARDVSNKARVFAASVRTRQGRIDEAARRIEEVLGALGAGDPEALRAEAHRERAWQLLKLGAYVEAERHVERALTCARASGDRHAIYSAIGAKAALLSESGRLEEGLEVQREALELARGLCLRRREAIELANLGEAYLELEQLDEARARFHEALEIFIEIGDRACEGDCRVNVGRALLRSGALEDAIAMLERARELCVALERHEYAAIASLHLGEAFLRRGAHDQAEDALASAYASFAEQGSPLTWRAAFLRAQAARASGATEAARTWAQEARTLLERRRQQLPVHVDPRGLERDAEAVRSLLASLA
ncbi:MAG: tetratricopeptide repeat protein [Myxococcales bacterium]|nr:tetratricopeptide repeat protein [Myxococcales bacterium]